MSSTLTPALADAVRAGKVNYIGLSNFTGWQLQLAVSTALHVPVTLQPQYSLVSREIEYEIVPAAQQTTWVCCRGHRWPQGSSVASTSRTRRPPRTRGAAPGAR
jgi:aryl-alcohol dehydrogenase-like predicted oxidoreductase